MPGGGPGRRGGGGLATALATGLVLVAVLVAALVALVATTAAAQMAPGARAGFDPVAVPASLSAAVPAAGPAAVPTTVPTSVHSTRAGPGQDLAAWEALSRQALLRYEQGRFDAALQLARQALALAEAWGAEHPAVEASLNAVAAAAYQLGHYDEAEAATRRELSLIENTQGAAAAPMSIPLHNLAATLERQGRDGPLAQVAPLLQRALAIHERSSGPDHPDTARALLRLAQFDASQDRIAEADAGLARAARLLDRPPGAPPPERAEVLAEVLATQGRLQLDLLAYDRAEPLLARAVARSTQALGADHPLTGQRLGDWATALAGQGDALRAEALLRRALAIAEQAAGPRSAETADALGRLAGQLRAQRRPAEAEALYRRAIELRAEQWAAAPAAAAPAYRQALDSLAFHHQAQGAPGLAEPLFRRALQLAERQQPADPAGLARAALHLAQNLADQQRPAEAEAECRRALALETTRLGGHHPRVAQLQGRLAALRWAQGDGRGAEALYQQALATLSAGPGADPGDAARLADDLALVYRASGRPAEAAASQRRADMLRKRP